MSLNIFPIFGGFTINCLFRNLFLIGPDCETHISDFSTQRHQISPQDTSIISWSKTSAVDSNSTQPPLSESAKKWVPKNPTECPLKITFLYCIFFLAKLEIFLRGPSVGFLGTHFFADYDREG